MKRKARVGAATARCRKSQRAGAGRQARGVNNRFMAVNGSQPLVAGRGGLGSRLINYY